MGNYIGVELLHEIYDIGAFELLYNFLAVVLGGLLTCNLQDELYNSIIIEWWRWILDSPD